LYNVIRGIDFRNHLPAGALKDKPSSGGAEVFQPRDDGSLLTLLEGMRALAPLYNSIIDSEQIGSGALEATSQTPHPVVG